MKLQTSAKRSAARGMSQREVEDIEEMSTPRTPVIYEVVRRVGEEEMERPLISLWWSGVAAGFSCRPHESSAAVAMSAPSDPS